MVPVMLMSSLTALPAVRMVEVPETSRLPVKVIAPAPV